MTESQLRDAVKELMQGGVQFLLANRYMLGERRSEQTRDINAVIYYLRDPEKWVAEAEGVTVEQMRRFDDCHGIPQCGATTRKGTRCKNLPIGATYSSCCDPADFVFFDGRFCTAHYREPEA